MYENPNHKGNEFYWGEMVAYCLEHQKKEKLMSFYKKLIIEEFKRVKDVVGKDELIRLLDESIRHPLVTNGTLRYGQCIIIEVPHGTYSNIFNCRSSEIVAECGYEVVYGEEVSGCETISKD